MRVKSIIVLLAIAFSILSPLSVHLVIAHEQTSIGTFDVCHAGSLALSTSYDTPCISQPLYNPHLPSRVEDSEISDPTLKLLILACQNEHPPKS